MRLHLPSLIACALLLACGPGAESSSDTDDATSGATMASSETGVDTDDTDVDTGVDTDEPPAAFSCDGARWAVVHDPGEFDRLAVDSLGRVYAFGDYDSPDYAGIGMLTRLDADGQATDIIKDDVADIGSTRRGGVDADDYVQALLHTNIQPNGYQWWIVRHDPSGARVHETYLNGQAENPFEPRSLVVAPDGATVLGGWALGDDSWVLQKRDASGALLWERSLLESVDVEAINADGVMAGAGAAGISVLEADGSLRWTYDVSTLHTIEVDLMPDGGAVVGYERDQGSFELVRLDPDGGAMWTTAFMIASEHDTLGDVAINASGELAVGGFISTGSPLTAWIARFSADGERLATHTCLDALDSRGHAVEIDRDGAMFLTGSVGLDSKYHGFVARFDPE